MMVFAPFALLLVAQAGETGESAGGKPTYTKREVKESSSAPVTQKEARLVIEKLARNISKVHPKLPKAPASKLASSSSPVTGTQLETELVQLAVWVEPMYKISRGVSRKALGDREWFRKMRFESLNGPLFFNFAKLSTRQVGDAVGFFLVRVADLTHTPSSEYTPGLMRG